VRPAIFANGPERHLVRRSGLVAFGGEADTAQTSSICRFWAMTPIPAVAILEAANRSKSEAAS